MRHFRSNKKNTFKLAVGRADAETASKAKSARESACDKNGWNIFRDTFSGSGIITGISFFPGSCSKKHAYRGPSIQPGRS
jgi:hypothetical protein